MTGPLNDSGSRDIYFEQYPEKNPADWIHELLGVEIIYRNHVLVFLDTQFIFLYFLVYSGVNIHINIPTIGFPLCITQLHNILTCS